MYNREFFSWCNAVIPTIFDDSMSYYQFLCKIKGLLEKTIKQIEENTDNIEKNTADITDLKEKVAYCTEFIEKFEKGEIGEEQLEAAITSWLDENGQVLTNYISTSNRTNMLLNINQESTLIKNGVNFKTDDNFKMLVWGANTSNGATQQRIGDVSLKKGKSYLLGGCPANTGDLTKDGYQIYLIETTFSEKGYSVVQPPIARCFSGTLEEFTVDHDLTARVYMNVGSTFNVAEANAIEIEPCVFDNDEWKIHKYAKNVNELTETLVDGGNRLPVANRAVLTRLAQTLISYATFNTASSGSKFFENANSNSKIFYEAPNSQLKTMFSPDCTPTVVNGKTDMVCSTTAFAMMYGIDYENSGNYHPGYNQLDPTMCSDIDFYNKACLTYHYSAEIAQMMWDKGYCFKPSENFENMQAGDLIFFASSGDSYQSDFLNINHIAVVGGRLGDNRFFFLESNTMPKFKIRSIDTLKKSNVPIIARVPYSNADCKPLIDLIPEDASIRNFSGTAQTVGTITPTLTLKKDTIYTLVGKYKSTSALNAEWLGACPSGTPSMNLSLGYGSSLKRPLFNDIFFLPIIPINDMTALQIYRYKQSSATLGTGTIEEIHLYEGLLPGWNG